MEERGLVLELPCVFPRHLGDLPELAQRFPPLTIVIDHLGKPPLGTEHMGEWAAFSDLAAELPNVCATAAQVAPPLAEPFNALKRAALALRRWVAPRWPARPPR